MNKELSSRDGIQKFMNELTQYQRERFKQIAHHLVYVGFEKGVGRLKHQNKEDISHALEIMMLEMPICAVLLTV